MRMIAILVFGLFVLTSCAWDGEAETLAGADINPGRGYFQWRGLQVVPPHHKDSVAPDVYQRFT